MTVFAPTGTVADDVSQFEVTFSDYIDVASFTAADVPVTQPGGETLPASQITVAAIVTGRPDLVNRFEVALPAQTAEGPGSSAALVRENRPRWSGRIGRVGPGESAARSYSYQLPHGVSGTGTIQIAVTADAADDLFEYNHASHADAEGNNAGQLRFDSTIAPYPDLLADTIHVLPASPKSGERVTLQWTERNSGSAALGRDTYTRVRITQAGSGAVAHDQWLYFNAAANSSLIAGGVVQRQTHFTFPEGPAGAQFRSRPRRQSL